MLIQQEAASERCRYETSWFCPIPTGEEATAVTLPWSLLPCEMSYSIWAGIRDPAQNLSPAGWAVGGHSTPPRTRLDACIWGWILPPLTSLKPRSYETPPENWLCKPCCVHHALDLLAGPTKSEQRKRDRRGVRKGMCTKKGNRPNSFQHQNASLTRGASAPFSWQVLYCSMKTKIETTKLKSQHRLLSHTW